MKPRSATWDAVQGYSSYIDPMNYTLGNVGRVGTNGRNG